MDERGEPLLESPRNMLASVAAALGWQAAGLWLVDEEAGLLRCVETWSAAAQHAEIFERSSVAMALPRGIGLPGRVWRDGEPRWVSDVTREANFPRARVAEACGLHAAMAVPIIAENGDVRGVVEFFRTTIGDEEDHIAAAILAIGEQVARVIEWKAAEAGIRWSEARKTAILSAAIDAIITIDHTGGVTEWNPAAERIFGYQRASVLGRELAELIVPPSLRERHRSAVARYMAGELGSGSLIGARTEVPAQGANGREFPVELTLTRVDLPGPAVVTAYVRDVSERVRLDTEREGFRVRSEELQAALLPHLDLGEARVELVSCYRPGEKRLALGGDFYDATEIPEGGLALVIGDVSGHGPEAAALAANLRASWRMLALAGREPTTLLHELELMVGAERRQPDLFVTLCCAWFSYDDGSVRVVSAGHPAPLLLTPAPISIAGLRGPPLGVVHDASWSVVSHPLPVGDQIMFYTDGLIEGRRSPGSTARLGLDGLIDLVPAEQLNAAGLQGLVESAVAANGSALPDDVAVMAVRMYGQ